MEKNQSFSFKTNIPAMLLFQSDVMKEGDGQYGHWKMYKVQSEAVDYVLFPSKGLQDRLDAIGNLEGRLFGITKAESDDKRTHWVITDETGSEVPFNPQNAPQVQNTPQGINSPSYKAAKSIQNTVSENVAKHEAKKENAMKFMAINRDAVSIVVNMYPELAALGEMDMSKDDLIKEKIKEVRKWLAENIYNDTPFIS